MVMRVMMGHGNMHVTQVMAHHGRLLDVCVVLHDPKWRPFSNLVTRHHPSSRRRVIMCAVEVALLNPRLHHHMRDLGATRSFHAPRWWALLNLVHIRFDFELIVATLRERTVDLSFPLACGWGFGGCVTCEYFFGFF